MPANQPDNPPALLLAVKIPSTDETIVLHLINAEQELPQHWTIGRASDCAVRLGDNRVSNHHATIRAEPMDGGDNYDRWGRRRYVWMLKDCGSTNGTFQDGIRVGGRGLPCPWLPIEDNDIFFIGPTKVQFSTDAHFTEPGITIGRVASDGTLSTARSQPEPAPAPPSPPSSSTVWDIVRLVLTGPSSLSNWLWWIVLAVLGASVLVLVEWIKSN